MRTDSSRYWCGAVTPRWPRVQRVLADPRLEGIVRGASALWDGLRQLSGDADYERYLAHFATVHAATGAEPLSRRAFYDAELVRRWDGINRCC